MKNKSIPILIISILIVGALFFYASRKKAIPEIESPDAEPEMGQDSSKIVTTNEASKVDGNLAKPNIADAGVSIPETNAKPTVIERAFAKQHLNLEKKLTKEEFAKLSQNILGSLPNKAELKKLTNEEVHETPKIIMEAGVKLGLIAQAIANEPGLQKDGFEFYRACASSEKNPNSVRALCFSNYLAFGKKLGLSTNENIVPASVKTTISRLQKL